MTTAPDDEREGDRRSPLLRTLVNRSVAAEVVDVDHHRIQGGMSVKTEYIIELRNNEKVKEGNDESLFDSFKISKTYHAFRTLKSRVKRIAEDATTSRSQKEGGGGGGDGGGGNSDGKNHDGKKDDWDSLSRGERTVVKYSESLSHLIQSENKIYIGKMNYAHVKGIAKKRVLIINEALNMMLSNFPNKDLDEQCVVTLMEAIETFFLTDHAVEDYDSAGPVSFAKSLSKKSQKILKGPPSSNKKRKNEPSPSTTASKPCNPVLRLIPLTKCRRRSISERAEDERALNETGRSKSLTLGEEAVSSFADLSMLSDEATRRNVFGPGFDNPRAALAIPFFSALGLWTLRVASRWTVEIGGHGFLLVALGSFCLGVYLPPWMSKVISAAVGSKLVETTPPEGKQIDEAERVEPHRRDASLLLRRSMASTGPALLDESEDVTLSSPLPSFPPNAELGTINNCWSEPVHSDFKVRGENYLADKKKVPSGSMIFPIRAADLFLTDACPENAGRIAGIFGGRLRDMPTFVINFRLPWGILLLYYEIPAKFLPYLRKRYDPSFDDSEGDLLPSLDGMTPGDRTVCRFLLGDDKHKNQTLKLIPSAVRAPWAVKSVVRGRPSLLGTKMPINYVYQPPDPDRKMAEYLEMDIDIVASAAARRIVSLCRPYTSALTLDLGFVVQGNEPDELPEQMLCATRLHGVDPMHAPPLPVTERLFSSSENGAGADEDDQNTAR